MSWYSQCSWCGGPFNSGNCRRCTNMSFGEEFVRNPDPISNDETPEFSYPPSQPQYESNLCEKCGNDSHYGYDCSPRFPLVYEQEPCYNQNYSENYYPQNSPSFPPQYLCCTRCGGPHEIFQCDQLMFDEPYCANYMDSHESFQCQPMNQNHFEHNSNYFGFDQTPQFFVTHQLPRRSNKDMLLDMARLIKNNRTLFNSNIFPHEEMSIRVLLAKERILKLIQVWDEKQIKPWSLPELLLQLSNDSRTIAKIVKQREEKRIKREQAANLAVQKEQDEQAAQSFTTYWNFPIIDDDD
ncbi:hypothetical protein Tco_0819512 [Tanacetum coccineum]|uniref:Uncharacterized protein n=1 Tax=Tanacetum coccineum TaxID=301880 RepID=A0ABQ5A7S7_9ASTR